MKECAPTAQAGAIAVYSYEMNIKLKIVQNTPKPNLH
jgi:hypothetical protein